MAASYEAATASVGGETLSTHTWTPQLEAGQQPRAVVVLFHGCTALYFGRMAHQQLRAASENTPCCAVSTALPALQPLRAPC